MTMGFMAIIFSILLIIAFVYGFYALSKWVLKKTREMTNKILTEEEKKVIDDEYRRKK
jgi:hypothetical protein